MPRPPLDSPPIASPDGGTPPEAWDETLLRVIEAGKLGPSQLADARLAGALAAHQKLESLFAALRGEPAEPPEPAPQQLGRYVIGGTLGAGAFGTVYLAHDPDLNRQVAIKVSSLSLRERARVRAGAASASEDGDDDPLSLRERARVRAGGERARVRADDERAKLSGDAIAAEARHAASLNHPGIVAIYDVGREADRLYIVMQYVPGQTLAELLRAGPLAPARAAELLAFVAEALHYAHKQGFVHRDLKPANILLDEHGRPLIADFGLAVTDETQRALAGQIAGTPEYMAPEQVRGETHRLDGRTDIWALGVILYESLTGRRPFAGQSTRIVLDEIEHRDPKPPRQINDSIPAELERIVRNCLAKQPPDRYATAGDLASHLRRWRKSRERSARRAIERAQADLSAALGVASLAAGEPSSSQMPPFLRTGNDAGVGSQVGHCSSLTIPPKQSELKRALRWITCIPAAIAAGIATHLIVLLLNRWSLEFKFLNPDSVFGRLICLTMSSAVLGAVTVRVAADVAPDHKKVVAVVAAGSILFLSGLTAYNIILDTDWWGAYQIAWTNVGAAGTAYTINDDGTPTA